ncbi:MAG: hypothetical protein F9K23_09705 [Bacteroidetes bacterium]|nr:MAG: hypothetical protein F9K23_09705 [Bacteroidota bacterium]
MINNYPRIWGLSTLGIIYHFNTDYKFHPFRTDFSGEGGSGKTMVADMLQLMLVGPSPGIYKSATEGTEERPIDGLVLQPKNKQYGAGYIILNIEIAPNEFIAMGCFIEKSSRQVKMFIAQAGFDWENSLTPLPKPVFYRDLLVNDKIIPVEELQEKLQDIHIKPLPLKQYHRLLFDNYILPVDLSESRKTLESYARIFRSFSRGSGFKTDSKSLKNFLFSDDDKFLLAKYYNEVKSISEDYQEHDRYKKEIELINKKQGFIKDVLILYNESNRLHMDYLTAKVYYWIGQQEKLQKEFNDNQEVYNRFQIERQLIQIKELELEKIEVNAQILKYRASEKALTTIRNTKQSLTFEKDFAYQNLQNAQLKKNNVLKVTNWLLIEKKDLAQLKAFYKNEFTYYENKKLLDSFLEYIDLHNTSKELDASSWTINFKNTTENYEGELQKSKRKLDELVALNVFADLQNPESLASWAIKYFNRPLNIEEESVLVYFQVFSVKAPERPKATDRYLRIAEELFSNLDIKDKDEQGFWINIDGVFEFIEYVKNQYLNINENEKQQTVNAFLKLRKGLAEEIKELTQNIADTERLKKILFEFSDLEKAITLYTKRIEYTRIPDSEWLMEENQFEELLADYANKEMVDTEYDIAKGNYEGLIKQESEVDPNNFERQNEDAIFYFKTENIDTAKLDEHLNILSDKITSGKNELKSLQQKLNMDELKVIQIESTLLGDKNRRTTVLQLKASHAILYSNLEQNYQKSEIALYDSNRQSQEAKNAYQEAFKNVFPEDSKYVSIDDNPDEGNNSLKEKYSIARLKFEGKYNMVAEEIEEGTQLIDTFHVGQLAHKLLPTVFASPKLFDESKLESQLTERLTKLYQVIKEIGSRKIEILKRVFTEVNKTYRDHLDKVGKIDQYFKNPNKSITGGNRGSLKYELSSDYPAKWMNIFTKALDDKLTNTGLFEQLAKEIDINEMMKKAFIDEGGTKDADIEDLLNPKSYFDLKFNLRLATGDANAGSNSQTYSGNALLGLARLSLIEDSKRKGIRIMPIDEAQGLGSNYEMLRNIAIEEGYQILSMSIDTAGEIREGEQYIYILNENSLADEDNYVPAMGVFSDNQLTANIETFIYANNN